MTGYDFCTRFQIEHGVGTYPHCYVVDNQSTIIWHGHPLDAAFKVYSLLCNDINNQR